jgi:hypothetical protein
VDKLEEIVIAEFRLPGMVNAMPNSDLQPPPLPKDLAGQGIPFRVKLLSLLILIFLLSGSLSFLDDTLLLFERTVFTASRVLVSCLMLIAGMVAYITVACLPGVPKRIFLTIALFIPVSSVAALPLLVYFHAQAGWIAWGMSLLQLGFGIWVVYHLKSSLRISWPLISASQAADCRFRFGHFAAVMLAGFFLVIPLLLAGTTFSAKLAIHHFTDGFVNLRTTGLTMDVREYVRDDGKKITLIPMSHVGEPEFYQELSNSFPEDAVVLLEGVSDQKNLFNVQGSYAKMAQAAGVVEQKTHFKPKGRLVPADMDMSEFSNETRELLKGAMLIHSKGITEETMPILMKPTPPDLQTRLMEDILTKRNQHLLTIIERELPNTREIIIPWGAAHMPEIAAELQTKGFKPISSREMIAIHFWN